MIKILKGDFGYSVVFQYNLLFIIYLTITEISCILIGYYSSSKPRHKHVFSELQLLHHPKKKIEFCF